MRDGDMGFLRPTDSMFADRPAVTINAANEKKLRNGAEITDTVCADGEVRVYSEGGFLALCVSRGGILRTVKSFFEVN
jgi:tRNA pseudouridine55 synthase